METVNTSGRLAALRSLMRERKVDVYGKNGSIMLLPLVPPPPLDLTIGSHR